MNGCYWWRDDDAGRDDPALASLLAVAAHRRRPVALAVVPDWLEAATAARILASPWATVIQHGVAHTDHARPGEKKVELGGGADRARLEAGLVGGRRRLEAAFGPRFVPVLAAPWNRIDPDVAARLPALGFCGLSCDGGPVRTRPLRRVDTHVDAIDWAAGARSRRADELEAALAAARAAQGDGPVGLLTHHQVVARDAWADLDRVLRFGHDTRRAVWATVHQVFEQR